MPLYDYECGCGWSGEMQVPISERDRMICPRCKGQFFHKMTRKLAAPMGRMAGQVVQGGGPDRLTADALGIPLKELPSGLKTKL